MARVAGTEIRENKKIKTSLTDVYGIGDTSAMHILKRLKVNSETRVKDLTSQELTRIRQLIEKEYKVEGELRQTVRRNIKRLKDIRCYRGIRHRIGLPVRGQRTRHNARTTKGHALPVAGLKRKLEKT